MSVQRYKAINGYGGDSDLIADDAGEIVPHTAYAALEAENARLTARCAGLEREAEKHKERREHFEALLNDSIRKETEWLRKALDPEAERDALQASLDSAHTSIDQICKDYRQRTNELDFLRVHHKQTLTEREELRAKLAAADSRVSLLEMCVATYKESLQKKDNAYNELNTFFCNAVARAERAEEALQFYADPAMYRPDFAEDGSIESQPKIFDDGGEIASAALADTTTDEVQP